MNRKKTAVLIINCLQGGGAERSVLTLGQGFYEIGYEVHILRFKTLVEYNLNPNLHYHVVKFKPYKLIPTNLKYSLFAKKVDSYVLSNIGQPDIVLSNLERPDRVMSFSQLTNLVHVIRNTITQEYAINTDDKSQKLINELQQVYSNHPCICISEGVNNDMQTLFGNNVVTHTIMNPFDKKEIINLGNQHENQQSNLENYGITPNNYIVHVGSFKHQKAHEILLQAYSKMKTDLPLVLVGQGKRFQEITQLAETLGIQQKVVFAGFHKNPYPFIKQARCMVLSSKFEGFGRVIVEAIALETPVISTDCPSGPREILPKQNLVPNGDIDSLTEVMTDCINNPQKYHVDFNNKFSPNNIAQQYIDFINS